MEQLFLRKLVPVSVLVRSRKAVIKPLWSLGITCMNPATIPLVLGTVSLHLLVESQLAPPWWDHYAVGCLWVGSGWQIDKEFLNLQIESGKRGCNAKKS